MRPSAGERAADLVEAAHQRQQRARRGARVLGLVLLGVEVLLAAGRDGDGLQVLEARVDAVARREGRRQHQARLEGRPAAGLEVLVEDVRGVDEEVGAEELRDRAGQLARRTRCSSARRVLPGEVGVRLAEAGLGEGVHPRRAGEGLGQEDHVGVVLADGPDEPLPEADRLGVGVVHAEDAAPRAPPRTPAPSRSAVPQRRASRRCEVDVVDVLVALGRVLRVLQRPVGAAVEPLRVLGAARGGRASTGSRSRARSRCRCRAAVATSASRSASVPDLRGRPRCGRPPRRRSPRGCPGSPGCGDGRVVAPLAVGDRRSGGSAAGRRRRSPARPAAGAAPPRPARPPKERGKSSYHAPDAGPLAVDVHLVGSATRTRSGRAGRAVQRLGHVRREGGGGALGHGARRAQRARRRRGHGARPAPRRPAGGVLEQGRRPRSSSLSRSSWPAASLRSISLRHDANGSTQASTWKAWRPRAVVGNAPRQRSGPTCAIGSSRNAAGRPAGGGARRRAAARGRRARGRTPRPRGRRGCA